MPPITPFQFRFTRIGCAKEIFMSTAVKVSPIDRYLEMHGEWLTDDYLKDKVQALPMLVLAETIERALPEAVSELVCQASRNHLGR